MKWHEVAIYWISNMQAKWFFHAGFMEISCIVVFHDVKAVVFHAEQHPDIQVCRSGVVY